MSVAAFRRTSLVCGQALATCLVLLPADAARAQRRGCTITPYTDPPRQVLACPDGFTLSAENASTYRLIDRNRDGRPEAADLNGRGLLVDAPPRQGSFQVRTPHAIASVRGTTWAVDVTPGRTSVFVQAGEVSVSRLSGPGVVLRAGDGVDVDAGTAPLEVKRWSRERAAGLLARFGR